VTRVLFVCVHNAGRSQMSQALFNQAAGGTHEARSAGTDPIDRVHPEVIAVMDELGIDLRGEIPKPLTRELAEWADVVVTMGCGDACPYVPGKRYLDWELEDPKANHSTRYAPRATRSPVASIACSPNSAHRARLQAATQAVNTPLRRRLLAELLGSAFLAAIVIGAGIAAQRPSPNDIGLQLFEDAAATAAGLFAIILMFGPVSGGHFNPVVSLVVLR